MPFPPEHPLPLHPHWHSLSQSSPTPSPPEDVYIPSLLDLATTNTLFRQLCGGIHILDFLTRQPPIYETVLPPEWRAWFAREDVGVQDILEWLLRKDVENVLSDEGVDGHSKVSGEEKKHASPPQSLLEYILLIRQHCLLRCPSRSTSLSIPQIPTAKAKAKASTPTPTPPLLLRGMKPKKIHEVQHFASYIALLSSHVATSANTTTQALTLVDFGSGQNYLGRTLVSPPYERDVVAIERRHGNVAGARRRDVSAKVAREEKVMRNKKQFRGGGLRGGDGVVVGLPVDGDEKWKKGSDLVEEGNACGVVSLSGSGSLTYIEHDIRDGRLEDIIFPHESTSNPTSRSTSAPNSDSHLSSSSSGILPRAPQATTTSHLTHTNLLTVSLHSCGNLSHHGLRTLTPHLNPSIQAVAIIGCCYNLLTERLTPPTYKHPLLRSNHPRLEATGNARDEGGFPMSRTLETWKHPPREGDGEDGDGDEEPGMRLNITARMMAVQAPGNWGREESEAFFTRHFYRALLQKMLLDVGIVNATARTEGDSGDGGDNEPGSSTAEDDGAPLVIGSLRKAAFTSFQAYVRVAVEKLSTDIQVGELVRSKASDFTPELIESYETRFAGERKELAIMWSLMAFSAGVVESIIVVDRWLWLREQPGWVGECWVEPIFDYAISPRNLVVVGIRKKADTSGGKEDTKSSNDDV